MDDVTTAQSAAVVAGATDRAATAARIAALEARVAKLEQVAPAPAPTGRLLRKANFALQGSFRLPNKYDQIAGLSYGGSVLAFDLTSRCLITDARGPAGQYLTKVTTKTPSLTTDPTALPMADVAQLWGGPPVLSRLQTVPLGGNIPLGGIAVSKGRLLGTVFAYYSGADTQTATHFTSLDVAGMTLTGAFPVGNPVIGRKAAGPICEIPAEWQARLGGTHLSGLGGAAIISTASSGPCAVAFDPDDPSAAKLLLYYPLGHELGPYNGPANPMWSGATSVRGIFWLPGTDTILFIGTTAMGEVQYQPGGGPQSLDGKYAVAMWAYDANDLLAVKSGAKQTWEPKPYEFWAWNGAVVRQTKNGAACAYDPAAGLLYVITEGVMGADFSFLPIVEVLKVTF